MATNNDQLITSESKIAFNCMYDLYFVRSAPGADPSQVYQFLRQFHEVNYEELDQQKPHILQASIPGKTVIEYMRNKNVRLCAKYVGPRPMTEPGTGATPHANSKAAPNGNYGPKPTKPVGLPPVSPAPNTAKATSQKTARKLRANGKFCCGLGVFGCCLIVLAFITAIITVFICLITSGRVYFFDDEIAGPIWGIACGLLGLGIYMTPLYLFGLHFLGQSQIITNTET